MKEAASGSLRVKERRPLYLAYGKAFLIIYTRWLALFDVELELRKQGGNIDV